MSASLPIAVSTRRMAPVTATAGQTEFPFTFPLIRATDVRVLRTRAGAESELTFGVHYTVAGVGAPAGGTVTLTAGSLAGDLIVIEGDADIDRLSSIVAAGRFSSAIIDEELDLAAIRDQELRRDITWHTHTTAAIADFQETTEDLIGVSLLPGPGMSVAYDDATGKTTLAAIGVPGGGSGNVVGPASSVDQRIAVFNGATGRLLADGGVTVAGFALSGHTHAIADVTGLQTELGGKAATAHTHASTAITDFAEAVDDRVAALLIAGSNITLTYDDAANTLTVAAAGGGGGAGALLRAPQILSSGTSYTTPAGCNAIYVECVGGGGGGAGGADTNNFGGGGGAGAYCARHFSVSPATAYTYAIGAGGAGGGALNGGGNGGATTFSVGAVTLSAGGGSSPSSSGVSAAGGAGGIASNGHINTRGEGGSGGGGGGNGGGSFFGGGAPGPSNTGNNSIAGVHGGGGGGGGISAAGSAGGAGIIRIWEYS